MTMKNPDHSAWKQVLYDRIGRAVAMKRAEVNMSTREVAFKLGCSMQSVMRIEEGLNAPVQFLVAFAQLTGCRIEDLIPVHPTTFTRKIEKSDG